MRELRGLASDPVGIATMLISDRWFLVNGPMVACVALWRAVGDGPLRRYGRAVEHDFVRARQPEQKEQRRAHLLATARALLTSGVPLRELSLSELARQAGVAKANVYRYFESREALVLALLWEEWTEWFGHVQRVRRRARTKVLTLGAVVSILVRTLARAKLLCELASALPTVIEPSLSEQAVRGLKHDTLAYFQAVAAFLHKHAPSLPAALYEELLRDLAHAVMVLYPATHPPPTVAGVLREPGLAWFRRDFEEELGRFAHALAADYARRAKAGSTELDHAGSEVSPARPAHAEAAREPSTAARPRRGRPRRSGP